MLHRFIKFLEFAEFIEFMIYIGKTPLKPSFNLLNMENKWVS